jgi:hypothetical protein
MHQFIGVALGRQRSPIRYCFDCGCCRHRVLEDALPLDGMYFDPGPLVGPVREFNWLEKNNTLSRAHLPDAAEGGIG